MISTYRRLTTLVLATLFAAVTAACGADSESGDQMLTVGCYGGSYGEGVAEAIGNRFEEETGATVEYVWGNPSDLVAQVLAAPAGSSPMDVICTDGSTQTDAVRSDILLPAEDSLPAYKEISTTFAPVNEGFSPGIGIWVGGVAYNHEAFKENGLDPIESWEDVWQPGLEERLAFPDITVGSGVMFMMAAAEMETGDPTDYKAGIDRVAQLDPYNVWTSSSDAQNDLASGNTWVSVLADGRANQLIDDGLPITFVIPEFTDESRGYADAVYIDIIKDTPNTELAQEFQRIAHEEDAQVDMYSLTGYAPTVPLAIEKLLKTEPTADDRVYTPEELESISVAPWRELAPVLQDSLTYYNQAMG